MDNTYEFLSSQYSKMREQGLTYENIKDNYDSRIVKSAWNVFGRFYKSKTMSLSESSYMLLLWCYSIFVSNKKIDAVDTLNLDTIADINTEISKWTFGENRFFNPITQESKIKIVWMLNKFSDIQISGQPFILKQ